MKVLIFVPPSYSQLVPSLKLGHYLLDLDLNLGGAKEIIIATEPEFKPQVEAEGKQFSFVEFKDGKQVNSGRGFSADDFISATRSGALKTLQFQSQKRMLDMVSDPKELEPEVQRLVAEVEPDRAIGNYIHFSLTQILYDMFGREGFSTFVPGHPLQLPLPGDLYGVPPYFPDFVESNSQFGIEHQRLNQLALQFRDQLARFYSESHSGFEPLGDRQDDPFQVFGAEKVYYNYDPALLPGTIRSKLPASAEFFGDYFVAVPALDPDWQAVSDWAKAEAGYGLINFGTFLSARWDVLSLLIEELLAVGLYKLIISAGSYVDELKNTLTKEELERVKIANFIPFRSLLEQSYFAVTHGGGNSFIETYNSQKPQLIAPFSTDQFSIAADAQRSEVATVIDPNDISLETLHSFTCAL